ncbi:hypothetical protein OQ252_09690, partial [Acetobacter farinalis]|nr:hypothetical protein [Acetobacter farinalis]
GGQPLICSKRRSKALQKTVNQIAKTQKLLAKHINQRFFDPSSFMLPAGVDSVRIVSRVSRPSEVIGPFVDDRRSLGVAVGAICFTGSNQRHQITTHLDGGASEGWHDAAGNSGYVWTKGNALLPLAAQTGGVMGMLTITAVPAEQYSAAPVQTPAALRHSA